MITVLQAHDGPAAVQVARGSRVIARAGLIRSPRLQTWWSDVPTTRSPWSTWGLSFASRAQSTADNCLSALHRTFIPRPGKGYGRRRG